MGYRVLLLDTIHCSVYCVCGTTAVLPNSVAMVAELPLSVRSIYFFGLKLLLIDPYLLSNLSINQNHVEVTLLIARSVLRFDFNKYLSTCIDLSLIHI